MKKFLMLMLFCMVTIVAQAAEKCELITGNALTNVRSDKEVYRVKDGGYVCDKKINNQECTYDSVILDGDKAVYCEDQDGITDTWVNFEEKQTRKCNEIDLARKKSGVLKQHGNWLVGSKYSIENGVAVCKDGNCYGNRWQTNYNVQYQFCKLSKEVEEVKTECPAGSSDKILGPNDCKSGQTFECERYSVEKCVCGKCTTEKKDKIDPLKKCLDSRTTREGKACCYLPEKVATWNGKECTCIPADKMEFEIGADGKGSCRAKELKTGEKFQCDTEILAQLDKWESECEDQEQIVGWIKRLKELCKSEEVNVQKFNEYYSTLLALGPGNCTWDNKIEVDVDVKLPGGNDGDRNAELSNSRRKISDAHAVLRGMASRFKVSEWKDEEGKFNTARLASDSVAAVVLGTTGALVTSNIVKKNQVENGFEDIKCTIGGQTVADWGDQFRVGIQ